MDGEESKVPYHETNEGRETQQGIAGFEGNNALWFLAALMVGLFIMQGMGDRGLMVSLGAGSIPIVFVSLYVFGLKQGKPKSYDAELFEWLIARASGQNYFSPRHVEKIKIEWVNPDQEDRKKKWGK